MCKPFCVFLVLYLNFGCSAVNGQLKSEFVNVDFYSDLFKVKLDNSILVDLQEPLSAAVLKSGYAQLNTGNYKLLIDSLLDYKEKHQLNDWLYYQLVRRVAQQISPKEINYARYTLYKWFMLVQSGYDARLALSGQRIIFYVFNDEDISDIPFFMVDGKKYMCLNYHDYAKVDLNADPAVPIELNVAGARKAFSYSVTRMPDFRPGNYREKTGFYLWP